MYDKQSNCKESYNNSGVNCNQSVNCNCNCNGSGNGNGNGNGNSQGVFGSFFSRDQGTYNASGQPDRGTILPLIFISQNNTPGAFTLNNNGTVTVHNAGTYLITGKIQIAANNSAAYAIELNGGHDINSYASGAIENGGEGSITALITLKADDIVSLGLECNGTTTLSSTTPGCISPTLALTLVMVS